MKIRTRLKGLLKAEPFVPVDIRTKCGRSVRINDPETVAFGVHEMVILQPGHTIFIGWLNVSELVRVPRVKKKE